MLAGFAQVRFHTAGTSYDPIAFEADGTVAVRPLGHALLFLHRWMPLGSHISSASGDPHILAARVSRGGHTSVIVSSFSPKPMPFTVAVRGDGGTRSHRHPDDRERDRSGRVGARSTPTTHDSCSRPTRSWRSGRGSGAPASPHRIPDPRRLGRGRRAAQLLHADALEELGRPVRAGRGDRAPRARLPHRRPCGARGTGVRGGVGARGSRHRARGRRRNTLQEKILALLDTGTIPAAEKLRAKVPPGLIAITRLPGLGPKRARLLHSQLGVDSLEALRQAALAGRLRTVKGLGPKFEASVLDSLSGCPHPAERRAPRLLLPKALELGQRAGRRSDRAAAARAPRC